MSHVGPVRSFRSLTLLARRRGVESSLTRSPLAGHPHCLHCWRTSMTQGPAIAAGEAARTDPRGSAIGVSMYHNPLASTLYYRVTRRGTRNSGVLSGMGSYYTLGGRYHRPHQRTVYASDDALVSITEMAFYQALEWQERIGGGRLGTPIPLPKPAPPTYPLVSSHWLWCFTLTVPPLCAVPHEWADPERSGRLESGLDR